LCREEAKNLSSSLKPQIGQINLVGIVHESLGVEEFRSQFFADGPIYLDSERNFFKLLGDRWLGLTGFFMPSVWSNIQRAKAKGIEGNMEGEGKLLGGLLVVGPNDQGVLFVHREEVWGDHAKLEDVLEACRKINSSTTSHTEESRL